MKGGPTCRIASRRRRNEMTSQDQPPARQRLPCKEGIAEAPIPSPAGPRRRDDEPMMKLRRRTPIVCGRVGRNGASQAQSNEDHKSSPSALHTTYTSVPARTKTTNRFILHYLVISSQPVKHRPQTTSIRLLSSCTIL